MYPKPDRPAFGTFVRTQVEALRDIGVEIEILFLDGPRRKLIYPRGVAQLRSRIAGVKPDVVHAHHGYVGAVAMTQRRVPVVTTFHGSDLLGAPGFDGSLTTLRRIDARIMQALGERVDEVIVQSAQMARRLRRPDVHIVPHEVDTQTFAPTPRDEARAELALDPNRPFVLFAAPPTTPVKNFALTRAALDRVGEVMPDVELLVIQQETQPRLALYMSACDVLALSSWQEGSPNIIKQAMACNLPIVATDVGDIREVIEPTEGCHVVPVNDVAQFAERLREELQLHRRTTGRQAVSHMTREMVARRIAAIYEHAANRAGHPGSQAL